MEEFFRARQFKAESLETIERCKTIIEDYLGQGLRLTLRQLYYQLVSANYIANEESSYKNLGSLVSDARLAGLLDWVAIEDRVRQPRMPSEWASLDELVDAAIRGFRLPRWEGQDWYVELWVEKDALAGVLAPIAHEYHVTMMVNRGYSSQSAMYESAARYKKLGADRAPLLLYLGDHDPSGEDMVRDIQDRLTMFGAFAEVRKIALTKAQIKKYKPPPNPAKITDSRAKAYIEKHGPHSWEVDALPPNVLAAIIREALDEVVDVQAMQIVRDREAGEKKRLKTALASLRR